MKKTNYNAFLALARAGLWETDLKLSPYEKVDFNEIYKLAEEQSVLGLVTAGLEHIVDVKVPQEILLTYIGNVLQMEIRNKEMNKFLAVIVGRLRKTGVYTVLVKGQGIAQCYERPLWRTAGDIDLLLDDSNFWRAKLFFDKESGIVANVMDNDKRKHLEYELDSWDIELHGTLHTDLYGRLDRVVDEVQRKVFCQGAVRSWSNNDTTIFLPSPDDDIIFVFTHILQHFSQGGIGLRQICDLCRLLYMYKSEIDHRLLKERLCTMRLLKEWKTFATLAVDFLGMPSDAYPLYQSSKVFKKKAEKVMEFVLEVGNMGHNRDTSYVQRYPYIVSKIISFFRESGDAIRHSFIFPEYSARVWCRMVKNGVLSVVYR